LKWISADTMSKAVREEQLFRLTIDSLLLLSGGFLLLEIEVVTPYPVPVSHH
jgi:hypothetical protein